MRTYEVLIKAFRVVVVTAKDEADALEQSGAGALYGWEMDEATVKELHPTDIELAKRHANEVI